MFYYKILDENGNIDRLFSSTAPIYNALEITEEEYNELMPKVEYTEEEYAEVLKAQESEVITNG